MSDFQKYFQDFLNANPKLIHMAGHSHHYWPDITKAAIDEAYQDACQHVDLKWNKIYGEVLPKTQKIISELIGFSHTDWIAFAPNTHELLVRVLSCFPNEKKVKILTTHHEFHSARRQFQRLSEEENYEVTWVEAQELVATLKKETFDLIYSSQVFFDSGLKLSDETISEIVANKNDALFLLDGYHSFCAIPISIKKFENDIFFLSGSYKYAQAGEGLCFMTIPKDCQLRPQNTGWFASFETLEEKTNTVAYSPNGARFTGATRDFTSHYRFNAIWEQYKNDGIGIEEISTHVKARQDQFINGLSDNAKSRLISKDSSQIGHFLSFQCDNHQQAKDVYNQLLELDILTDFRDRSLRFGFGMYISEENIINLLKRLNNIAFFS